MYVGVHILRLCIYIVVYIFTVVYAFMVVYIFTVVYVFMVVAVYIAVVKGLQRLFFCLPVLVLCVLMHAACSNRVLYAVRFVMSLYHCAIFYRKSEENSRVFLPDISLQSMRF